jgi:hypothetical protein
MMVEAADVAAAGRFRRSWESLSPQAASAAGAEVAAAVEGAAGVET